MVLKQNPEQTVMRPFSKSYFDYIHYNNYSFWFWVFSITLILTNVHNFLFLFTSRLSSCTCGPCGGAGHGHSCCCKIIFCASVGSVITCLIQIRCFTLEMNINRRFEGMKLMEWKVKKEPTNKFQNILHIQKNICTCCCS